MKENGWKVIGRIAKARRERLGLKQDELAQYGGPGVATVGKFERAAQESFPVRTQHQIENALGWGRTTIEQVVSSIDDGSLTILDWEYDLVEENVPDLSRPRTSGGDRTLEEAVEAVRAVLRLLEPEQLDQAVRSALIAIVPMLTEHSAGRLGVELHDTFPLKGGDGHDADELADRRAASMNDDADIDEAIAALEDQDNPPGAPEE